MAPKYQNLSSQASCGQFSDMFGSVPTRSLSWFYASAVSNDLPGTMLETTPSMRQGGRSRWKMESPLHCIPWSQGVCVCVCVWGGCVL